MADLTTQKKLAAQIMKCSPKKVRFDTSDMSEFEESITRSDLRDMISKGMIYRANTKSQSRSRARKLLVQKAKGKRKGKGSRKGTANARSEKKKEWIIRIRKQRSFLKSLRDSGMIARETFRYTSNKAKGGYFRSVRHMKLYLNENKLFISKSA